jgi:hypothetical protein
MHEQGALLIWYWQGKSEVLEKKPINPFPRPSVHQKPHTYQSEIQPGPPMWQAGNWSPQPWQGHWCNDLPEVYCRFLNFLWKFQVMHAWSSLTILVKCNDLPRQAWVTYWTWHMIRIKTSCRLWLQTWMCWLRRTHRLMWWWVTGNRALWPHGWLVHLWWGSCVWMVCVLGKHIKPSLIKMAVITKNLIPLNFKYSENWLLEKMRNFSINVEELKTTLHADFKDIQSPSVITEPNGSPKMIRYNQSPLYPSLG